MERILSDSFYESGITLIAKYDKALQNGNTQIVLSKHFTDIKVKYQKSGQ